MLISVHESLKTFLFYRETSVETSRKLLTFEDLFEKLEESFEKQQKKLGFLQKKLANSQLRSKIHECEAISTENPEESRLFAQIRDLFENCEYSQASELLKKANYSKKAGVSYEEMQNWLILSNRVKDFALENAPKPRETREIAGKRRNHGLLSTKLSGLLQENRVLREKLENSHEVQEKLKENREKYNEIVHQKVDCMKLDYIEQIRDLQGKIEDLQKENREFCLIIDEYKKMTEKQREIIAKNEKKFENLKKISMFSEKFA